MKIKSVKTSKVSFKKSVEDSNKSKLTIKANASNDACTCTGNSNCF